MDSTDRKYTVYMHTAPNGKKYIGITCQSISMRWGNCGGRYKRCKYFWKAIVKYGWENITHDVLAEGLTAENAKQREKELICFYKTQDSSYGYNLTDGGDGISGVHHSEETKAAIAAALMGNRHSFGIKRTDETRAKMSAALLGNQRTLGYKPTAETLKKMSAVQMGNRNTLGYKHTVEARVKMSASRKGITLTDEARANISAANKGRIITDEARRKMRDAHNLIVKDIECLTTDGEIVTRYDSLADAAEKTGIQKSSICNVCFGKRKTAGGYKWRYV